MSGGGEKGERKKVGEKSRNKVRNVLFDYRFFFKKIKIKLGPKISFYLPKLEKMAEKKKLLLLAIVGKLFIWP